MTDQEKYADKIAALLRKAESTTPEEAELLMDKAQELMEKYSIDEAMLRMAGVGKEDQLVSEEFVITGIYRFPLSDLAWVVITNSSCKAVILDYSKWPQGGWRKIGDRLFKQTVVIEAVGYKSDVDRARMLYTSLQIQAMRAEKVWWDKNSWLFSDLSASKQHLERRQFLKSFALGVNSKMSAAIKRARAAASVQHGVDSVALVVQDKSHKVLERYNELHSTAHDVKDKKKGGSVTAHQAGIEAGRNADTGQPNLAAPERGTIGK